MLKKKWNDISLNSESLHYVFKELWGREYAFINARFQIPKGGEYSRFRKFEGMAASLNHGKEFVFDSNRLRLKSFIKKKMNLVKKELAMRGAFKLFEVQAHSTKLLLRIAMVFLGL